MAVDKRLLEILCCPVTRQPVMPLNARQLDVLKQAQQDVGVKFADGSAATEAIEAALITRDGKRVYLIVDGIPVMLADQVVATSQFSNFPA